MNQFELVHPTTAGQAARMLADGGATSHAMAGGQDLLGIMKDYIRPVDRVVDLKRIASMQGISFDAKRGLRIGALTTLIELEEHPIIRRHFPALAEAARSVGSPQIRNVGTLGGNLCQRPRCWYFRNENIKCLKKGGDKCYASPDEAENKYHAIIAGGPCHIVHPSDLASALIALDAVLTVVGADGSSRKQDVGSFYTLPSEGSVLHETVLKPGDIVTEAVVPVSPLGSRSTYLKFRERESFDWSLSSTAVALDIAAGLVREARIVLGGVAPVPWRSSAAEAVLRGKALSDSVVQAAALAAVAEAEPLSQNGYKVALIQTIVKRALRIAASGPRVAFETAEGSKPWRA